MAHWQTYKSTLRIYFRTWIYYCFLQTCVISHSCLFSMQLILNGFCVFLHNVVNGRWAAQFVCLITFISLHLRLMQYCGRGDGQNVRTVYMEGKYKLTSGYDIVLSSKWLCLNRSRSANRQEEMAERLIEPYTSLGSQVFSYVPTGESSRP